MYLWADGFDQYGGTLANLQQAGYSGTNIILNYNSANARTQNGYISTGGLGRSLNRAITNPQRVQGQGCGINIQAAGNTTIGMWFGAGSHQITICPNTNLGFTFYQNGTAVGSTPNNLYTLSSWFWIEAKATMNSGVSTNDGSVEFRFKGGNGATGGNTTIVNGLNISNTQFTFDTYALGGGDNNNQTWFGDWVQWDTTGTYNNNFLGDRRCWNSYPNGNGATQNWLFTGGAATAWQSISNVPPVDTKYIYSSTVGDISEFTGTATGIATNDIAAVVMWARNSKSDAGTCSFQLGMNSGGFVTNSPAIAPGTSFAYAQAVFERDPNGSVQWTKASVDAALRRVTRNS